MRRGGRERAEGGWRVYVKRLMGEREKWKRKGRNLGGGITGLDAKGMEGEGRDGEREGRMEGQGEGQRKGQIRAYASLVQDGSSPW